MLKLKEYIAKSCLYKDGIFVFKNEKEGLWIV